MTFEKAKQEFAVRYYLWAVSEFEREIDESFPNLPPFQSGRIWETHRFMQQLEKNDQLVLAHALVKKSHSEAVQALGEICSEEEENLYNKLKEHWHDAFMLKINSKKKDAEKIKSISKNKLRRILGSAFTKAYGSRCVKILTAEKGWDPWFEMQLAGWIIVTRFTFGRGYQMGYAHSIQSEAKIPHPELSPEFWQPTFLLGREISFAAWLGINFTEWEHITNENIEPICDAVLKHCGHFFEAAPKLLKGLEFEKITTE